MSDKFPTATQVAQILRGVMIDRTPLQARGLGTIPLPIETVAPLVSFGWPDTRYPAMDIRGFDVTLDDGRVYRVRVSNITPEREEVS